MISDLRLSVPLLVWVFWEDHKEPTHILDWADHHHGKVPIYHTLCGSTFRWMQDGTGPVLLWRGRYLYKMATDCPVCVFLLEVNLGQELPPLPKGVYRYIDGKLVEVTDEGTIT